MSDPKHLIEIQDVTKYYGPKLAVDNISLSIPEGELFACLGPNGAGKTTTIKMLTGLLRPTSGTVKVAGFDMTTDGERAREFISYVPDQPHLYDKLTGRDFFAFIRDIYGLDPVQARQDEERLIDTFEMNSYVDNLTETYSHGMRQRLAFAAALLHRPRVLIVDEPMVGLDPKSTRIVKNLMKQSAQEGTTVFMSTHTLGIAEEIADRIGIICFGKVLHCGTVEELRQLAGEGTLEELFLRVTDQRPEDDPEIGSANDTNSMKNAVSEVSS